MITLIHWFCAAMFVLGPVMFVTGLLMCFKSSRKNKDLSKTLNDLKTKSQLELDIEFATTQQLIDELSGRAYGCIVIIPPNNNSKNFNIHTNMPNDVTAALINLAASTIPVDF